MLQNGAAFYELLNDYFIAKRGKGSYKTGQLLYYKTGQGLLQNGAAFEVYYKTGQVLLRNGAALEVYYITGHLLQNAPLHLESRTFLKRNKYHILRELFTFHPFCFRMTSVLMCRDERFVVSPHHLHKHYWDKT